MILLALAFFIILFLDLFSAFYYYSSTMRIAVLFSLMSVSSAVAFERTDYNCLNQCTESGSMYSFCKSKCSYDSDPAPSARTDYSCMDRCQSSGSMYSFCKSKCSY